MDVAEVKNALAARSDEVCAKLLPHGRKEGAEWCVGSLQGEAGKSLRVHLAGGKAGVWKDFSGDVGGDNLLELWIQARGIEFKAALHEAKEFLGIRESERVKNVKPAKQYKKPQKRGIAKVAGGSEVLTYLVQERGLSVDTVTAFKIAQHTHEKFGLEIVLPSLNETAPHECELIKYLAMKRDADGKKQIRTSAESKKCLFGKHTVQPGHRSLLISEGEIDAMSWHEIAVPGLCCTSVPFGAKWESKSGSDPNQEWIENDWDFLEEFERIYLAFDMDEEGQKAVRSIIPRLGLDRCFVVSLPRKDANECLLAEETEAMKAAIRDAKTIDPEKLKNVKEFAKDIHELFYSRDEAIVGIPMPFASNTGQFNWRMHEVTICTGINGSGKSMWLSWMMVYFMGVGKRCMIGSFEVPSKLTARYMVSQVIGADEPAHPKHLDASIEWLAQGLWFYDQVGHVNHDELFPAMIYAHRRYGVSFFVLDSLARLGIDDDDYKSQKALMDRLTNFASQYPIHVILVIHPRKAQGNQDGNRIADKSDVKGSGAMTDLAHNLWNIWRNKRKEKTVKDIQNDGSAEALAQLENIDNTQHDAIAACQKQRNGTGDEPEIPLWYNKHSRQYFTSKRTPQITVPADAVPPPPPDDPGEVPENVIAGEDEPF